MVDGIKDGAAPKAVTTYMEPESLTAFQTGQARVHAQLAVRLRAQPEGRQGQGQVRGRARCRTFEGGGKAGILGGHNSVISVYSKNPGGALKLIDFIGSPEIQKRVRGAVLAGAGARGRLRRPGGQEGDPVRDELREAITQARARPVSPVYPQISQAIYKNVNAALSGQQSPEDAMKQAQADIEKALSTF